MPSVQARASALTSATTTACPRACSMRAVAWPIPAPAPVTIATGAVPCAALMLVSLRVTLT